MKRYFFNEKTKEFSKKLYNQIHFLVWIVTIFTFVMVWRTGDLTPLAYLIPAAFADHATAVGFYYSKAKAENKIKLMKLSGVEPRNEDFLV